MPSQADIYPKTDMHFFHVAHGKRNIPKLVEEFRPNQPLEKRERAIYLLCHYCHDTVNLLAALDSGILSAIKDTLADLPEKADLLKTRIFELLLLFTHTAMGRSSLFESRMISKLRDFVKEEKDHYRNSYYQILNGILSGKVIPRAKGFQSVQLKEGQISLLQDQPEIIEYLLEQLVKETMENQSVILEALCHLLKPQILNPEQASQIDKPMTVSLLKPDLQLQALQTLLPFIEKHQPAVFKSKACQCMAALFSIRDLKTVRFDFENKGNWQVADEDGKSLTLRQIGNNNQVMTSLLALLSDSLSPLQVQWSAMLALLGLTVEVEAKKSFVREGGNSILESIFEKTQKEYLDNQQNQDLRTLLLYTIQTTANICEEFRARLAFQGHVALLQKVQKECSDLDLINAADHAIKVITWRP